MYLAPPSMSETTNMPIAGMTVSRKGGQARAWLGEDAVAEGRQREA